MITKGIYDKIRHKFAHSVTRGNDDILCVKEGRYVAVLDVPGTFLHMDMEQDVHMLLEGTIAEPVIKFDPKQYRKYI